MIELLYIAGAAVVAFVVGAGVGAEYSSTVTKAIATLQAAEKSAAATLATITAHKAS
jgi:hypothetical protein